MNGPWKFWALLALMIGAGFLVLHRLSPAPQPFPTQETAATEPAKGQEQPGAQDLEPAESSDAVIDQQTAEEDSISSSFVEVGATEGNGTLVQEAAARIHASRPGLAIVFSTGCSLSRAAFPQFVHLAEALAGRANVVAFATDTERGAVDEFLLANPASFQVETLEPWAPGEFSAAMSNVGISVGARWTKPLIAVVGRDGEVIGQWQGITDLQPVVDVLRRDGIF